MRYQNTQDFYDTQIIFELLACFKPGFQGHEQRRRLIEMENNSNFSHIRTPATLVMTLQSCKYLYTSFPARCRCSKNIN